MTIKVAAAGRNDHEGARHERQIASHLRKSCSHEGCALVRHVLNDFEIENAEGKFLGLVYEPLREPLYIFQSRMPEGTIPPSLLKAYIWTFLKALDHLHTECHIIHTGE